jgi:outer membrane lipoprotein-sorting protein
MRNQYFQVFLFLFVGFSFACNREKVNLEGRWEIAQVSTPKSNLEKDSISQLLSHLTVGNKLDFTGGELMVNRKGTGDSTYYGWASYKVANNGKSIMIDAGNYKPLKFKLRNTEDDQVEMLYKRQNLKVLLREPVED